MTTATTQRLRLLSLFFSLLGLFCLVKGMLNPGFYTAIANLSIAGLLLIETVKEESKFWMVAYGVMLGLFLALAILSFSP